MTYKINGDGYPITDIYPSETSDPLECCIYDPAHSQNNFECDDTDQCYLYLNFRFYWDICPSCPQSPCEYNGDVILINSWR